MKFVVIDGVAGEEMFLFPSTLAHNDVARRVGGTDVKVVSAGTVIADDPDDTHLVCVGESTTLQVKARGAKDDSLLRVLLRTYS